MCVFGMGELDQAREKERKKKRKRDGMRGGFQGITGFGERTEK